MVPSRTLMLSLFMIAARVKQYKDRVLPHLPLPGQGLAGAGLSKTLPNNHPPRYACLSVARHVWPTRRRDLPSCPTTTHYFWCFTRQRARGNFA